MSKKTRAKFTCNEVTTNSYSERATLNAVYADGKPEHNGFAQATPWGELVIQIDNPAAKGFFKPGKNYFLDISEEE